MSISPASRDIILTAYVFFLLFQSYYRLLVDGEGCSLSTLNHPSAFLDFFLKVVHGTSPMFNGIRITAMLNTLSQRQVKECESLNIIVLCNNLYICQGWFGTYWWAARRLSNTSSCLTTALLPTSTGIPRNATSLPVQESTHGYGLGIWESLTNRYLDFPHSKLAVHRSNGTAKMATFSPLHIQMKFSFGIVGRGHFLLHKSMCILPRFTALTGLIPIETKSPLVH